MTGPPKRVVPCEGEERASEEEDASPQRAGLPWPGDFDPVAEGGLCCQYTPRTVCRPSPISAAGLCPFQPALRLKDQGFTRTGSWHLLAWRLDPALNNSYAYTSTFFTLVLNVKFNFTLPGVNRMRNCRAGHHTYPLSLLTGHKPPGFPRVSLVAVASS